MAGRIRDDQLEPSIVMQMNQRHDFEQESNCPLCFEASPILNKIQSFKNNHDVFNYYKCFKCQLIFLGEKYHQFNNNTFKYIPIENNLEEQNEFFSGNDYYKDPNYMFSYWLNEKKQIVKFGYSKGKILDVGCAAGQFLDKFDNKFEKYGVELSELASLAREKNIEVFHQPIEQCELPDEHFDIITLYATIEHLSNPFHVVDVISQKLKKGGLFVLGTQNYNCLLTRIKGKYYDDYIPPEHLYLFSWYLWKRYLQKVNFKIIFKKYINGGYFFFKNKYLRYFELQFSKRIMNKYPLNQLPIYDHFYIYAQKQ